MSKPITPIEDRFWSQLDKRGPEECWPWIGHHSAQGYYGAISEGGRSGSILGAHRVSWELNVGPIPAEMWVLHRCDNRPCCNPGHLFLGTAADNTEDMMRKGRHRHGDGAKGEAHPGSKLTAIQVADIRSSGTLQRELAREYGVSLKQIWRIQNGLAWR